MSDKKVCEVCGREQCDARLDYKLALNNANAKLECYRLGYERLAAILTPEVLRLVEAGREMLPAEHQWIMGGTGDAWRAAQRKVLAAALAIGPKTSAGNGVG